MSDSVLINAFLGILAIVLPMSVGAVGWGLKSWAEKLTSFSTIVDGRLQAMQDESTKNWEATSRKIDRHEERLQEIHIIVERRLTRLEAITMEERL